MHSRNSSKGLSFFTRANTYFARASGSASHLEEYVKKLGGYLWYGNELCGLCASYSGSKTDVSQTLNASEFSINIFYFYLFGFLMRFHLL